MKGKNFAPAHSNYCLILLNRLMLLGVNMDRQDSRRSALHPHQPPEDQGGVFIPLHPIAEQILALYNTTDNSKPVFPLPPYANYRLYKEFVAIGIFLGLDRNLSHHDARHTNATLLVSTGVNMESVSKMMGHSSIKSTQKYAQITVNRISKDIDKLMERRKEKEQQIINL